jgi:hypothetical protein
MARDRGPRVRSRRLWLLAVPAIASGMAIAGPVGAQAPPTVPTATLRTDRTCYTPNEEVRLTGTGFTPGGQVTIALSRGTDVLVRETPLVADAAGALSGSLRTPQLTSRDDPRERAVITASDVTRASTFGAVQIALSAWAVAADNPSWSSRAPIGDPRRMTRFRLIGFTPATRAWLHYRFGGRTVRTVPLGALRRPCGDTTKRMREFPFRPVRAGQWRLVFSGTPRFDPRSDYIAVPVRVPRAEAVP